MSDDQSSDHITLRDVTPADLPIFFEHQRQAEANRMAVFEPRDRAAFMEHWRSNILGNDAVIKQTVVFDGKVAGNIVCYEQSGQWLVGYWATAPCGARAWRPAR